MTTVLYSALLAVALAGYVPVLLARRLRGRRPGAPLRHRLGRIGEGLPPEPRCWVHAVSVGESIAAIPLIEEIRRRWPDLSVVVTTVTPTGAHVVKERLAGVAEHRYFPVDLPGPVRRAVDAVRPRFVIGMETELWPNFYRVLAERAIPTMIANGRISDRSFRRYRLVRGLMGAVLRRITVLAMQSEEDARRIMALGAPAERVVVTGSLKADQPVEEAGARELWERLLGLTSGEPVWIAGSTHRGEDEAVLDAFATLRQRFPGLRLLLAPRHPDRVEDIERLAQERHLSAVRRSALPRAHAAGAVVILDTVGELANLYRVADVVFVGGSLVPTGGHNMLEPALRAKPVLFGPHTGNFRDSAELLLRADGARLVRDGAELERVVEALLADPSAARAMGERGFRAVVSRQGAVRATIDLIEKYLEPAGSGHEDRSRRG